MSDAAHAVDSPDRPPSLFATVVGGFGLLLVFGFLVMFFIGRGAYSFQDVDAERDTERYKILDEVKAGVKKAQEGPAWVNKDKGVVSLSLEKSMLLTEEKLKAKKPTPGSPVQAAQPAVTTPPPSNAATPATPASSPSPAAPK